MAVIKQEWTGYASGAAGGSSGWFPQIKEAVAKIGKSIKKKAKKSKKMAGASSSYKEKT